MCSNTKQSSITRQQIPLVGDMNYQQCFLTKLQALKVYLHSMPMMKILRWFEINVLIRKTAEFHDQDRYLFCGLTSHSKRDKTITQLEEKYYQPHLKKKVVKNIQKCSICQRSKGVVQNTSLCTPLSVPQTIWEELSMDFILRFPKTQWNFDFILVIVDRFSKISHLLPCKKIHDANHVAFIFFKEVMRLHGLPKTITSDRDAKVYWTLLERTVETTLNYTLLHQCLSSSA